MYKILIATHNPGKLAEFRSILEPLGIYVYSMSDFPDAPEPIENGDSLEANALIKAKSAFEHTGLVSLADDTGLEVSALNGAPGVHSARYSEPNPTPEKNVAKLLEALHTKPDRSAQFRTVLALYPVDHKALYFEGKCKGTIAQKCSGEKGFGYDPVFKPEGYDLTFADMSAQEKNKISHRGNAIRKFTEDIRNVEF